MYDRITQTLNNQNDEAKSVASEKSMSIIIPIYYLDSIKELREK